MKTVIAGGLTLGVLVALWSIGLAVTHGYLHPTIGLLFVPVAILLQLLVLVAILRILGHGGLRYWPQVGHGVAASVLAALPIFGGSLLVTQVLEPDYVTNVLAQERTGLEAAGMPAGEIELQMAARRHAMTPLSLALSGVIGTVATGLVLSLVIATFTRKRV